MAQPSGTETSAVGEASPGTTLIRFENSTKRPMLPIIGRYFIAPWPILFSSRSATPSDIGLRSRSLHHLLRAAGVFHRKPRPQPQEKHDGHGEIPATPWRCGWGWDIRDCRA